MGGVIIENSPAAVPVPCKILTGLLKLQKPVYIFSNFRVANDSNITVTMDLTHHRYHGYWEKDTSSLVVNLEVAMNLCIVDSHIRGGSWSGSPE